MIAAITSPPITPKVRAVFDAPRGRRFSRAGVDPRASASSGAAIHERMMLDRMRDNPRVSYRLEHGELPEWMRSPPRPPARPVTPVAGERPGAPSGRHRAARPRRRSRRHVTDSVLNLACCTLVGLAVALVPHMTAALL